MATDKYTCKAVIALLGEIRDILIDIRDGNTRTNTTKSATYSTLNTNNSSPVKETNTLS